jgi:hypothetical protein
MKDQYIKAFDIFDADNNRFWTRFNISSGLQLIMVAGLASNYEALNNHKIIGCLIILVAFAFSVFTALVMRRSYQISMGMFKAIQELENIDQSLVLLKTYIKNSRSPMGVMCYYCLIMSLVLTLFWLLFLIIFIIS